jgi:hypothetical protein
MSAASAPSVFVSYSHDSEAHEQRVLALADRLRADGIDVRLDQYDVERPFGWLRWMEQQVVDCKFVLVVCTSTYRKRFDREDTGDEGQGAKWEASIAQQILYEAGTRNDKLVPVLFEEGTDKDVPLTLRAYTRYRLPGDYEGLLRRLTGQPRTPPPPIGPRKVMPPAARPVFGVGLGPGGGSGGGASAGGTAAATAAGVMVVVVITDEALVDELAKVLFDEGQARLVATRAGFSPGVIPAFRMPIVFWTTVVDAARNGAIAGGVGAIAEAAGKLFPGNAIFSGYRSRSR